MKKHLIVIEKTVAGFSAYSPDIAGCIATGKTKNEIEKNMYDAIRFHLEGLEATMPKSYEIIKDWAKIQHVKFL